ncbi:MAG: hypothetical protein PVH19_08415 [Planctomycetia bacterium]
MAVESLALLIFVPFLLIELVLECVGVIFKQSTCLQILGVLWVLLAGLIGFNFVTTFGLMLLDGVVELNPYWFGFVFAQVVPIIYALSTGIYRIWLGRQWNLARWRATMELAEAEVISQ